MNVKNRVKKYLEKTDVYLVFDRYDDFSTKSVARGGKKTGVTRTHQLRIEAKLPAQNVVLTGVENKKQLISIIFGELIRDRLFHVECTKGHKLVVTGEQPCPVKNLWLDPKFNIFIMYTVYSMAFYRLAKAAILNTL